MCRRTVRFNGHVSGDVGRLFECVYCPRLRQSFPRDKWVDGWMNEWMDGWLGRWVGGWMDGWMDMENWWNGFDIETRSNGRNPILVPHYPQQKQHGLAWDRNQASAVTVLRRTCEGEVEMYRRLGKHNII